MLSRLIQKIFQLLLAYIYDSRFRYKYGLLWHIFDTDKEDFIRKAMNYVRGSRLGGDYLEFGVYRGVSFSAAYHLARLCKNEMNFYAFDSFEGLPETKDSIEGFRNLKRGYYSISEEDFKKIIKRRGVDLNKVKIVRGWYDQVLNDNTKKRLPLKKAAFIYVDCDVYESTLSVLDFIVDYIQDGTILAFAYWNLYRCEPIRGEFGAFKKWLSKNKEVTADEFFKFGWHGNSFILRRRKK